MDTEHTLFDIPPSKPLRIGCAGLGFIFRHAHSNAIRWLQRRNWPVEVTAICDKQPEAINEALRHFPRAAATNDLQALLGRAADYDALLICLWPPLGLTFLEQAIDFGLKAIMIEKPVSDRSDEIFSVAKKARSPGVKIHVAYNRLCNPALSGFLQAIRGLKNVESVCASLYRVDRKEPRFYEDVSPHALGTLRAMLGELAVQSAQLSPPKEPQMPPESLQAVLRSRSGVCATLDMRRASGCDLEHYSVLGGDESLDLWHLGGEPVAEAGWWHTRAGFHEFHPVSTPAGLDNDLLPSLWKGGYLSQMARFIRSAAGEAGGIACPLDEAAQIVKLAGEVMKTNLEPVR